MIVLSGTIGAGKSTLTKLLAEHLHSNAFYETVDDNEILKLFYADPKKYGFLLQVYFMNKRLNYIQEAQDSELNVLDRSIFEDALLFKLNSDLGRATEAEVEIHQALLENMMEKLPGIASKDPGLLIYIRVSFDTMLQRIKMRGRSFEQIDQDPDLYEYYKELTSRYDAWYHSYDRSPKMIIDGDKLDFVADPAAAQEVLKMIDQEIKNLKLK
ncbi:deoxyadenosine/deoxycytidine kinase [Weissella beninensis]|uniref:Deoxynucleoside kinase n=1 Tax=Periweissella beninensis TaxID=504936 RepID=A0ABT0VNF6_9LACO|nr:deoxynucleoside kinase [Periweissella beninensis]MBM7543307.1 deoxyadenosine/deoxycytidine kinase [Periweissella beninensis]MCM2437932.1 deoxynucleoside kinase [Periweissella beninensis]